MTLRALLIAAIACLGLPAQGAPTTRWFRFETAPGREAIAEELAEDADRVMVDVASGLGVEPSGKPILVRVLHGDEAFQAALPGAGAMTEWAAGVAFPGYDLILLKIDPNTRFTVHDVFRHEVSHIALERAVAGRALPLWFVEGVAVRQAGERLAERWQRTAEATLGSGLLPLAALDARFPQDGAQVDLAYAEAASFVGYLLQKSGWGALRRVIALVRSGDSFASAFRSTYGRPLEEVEADWRAVVEESASWIPIVTGASLIWILVVGLFFWSWLQKKRQMRARLASMPHTPADDEFA